MKKQVALSMAAALCALSGGVMAGGDEHEGAKPQMYCIYKESVKPALMKQYEDSIKRMISEFKAYQISPEKVGFKCISGPDIGYLYVMKMDEGWQSMDSMRTSWMEAIEALGQEKFEEILEPAHEAMESVSIFHSVYREDLSYIPENPRLQPGEVEYVHYGFYYGIPGQNEKLEELAKKFKELYARKKIDNGWRIYQSVTGEDLPLLVVAHGAKSAADFYTTRERTEELLGEEGKKLGEKVMAVVRKIDHKEGHPRPDLSYTEADVVATR